MKGVILGISPDITIVLYLDRFGNAATNIEETLLPPNTVLNNLRVVFKGRRGGFKSCYAEGAHGELCALGGSARRIELFVNQGDVGDVFGIKPGDRVEVYCSPCGQADR